MNSLCIDIGNSLTKIGLFSEEKMVHFEVLKDMNYSRIKALIAEKAVHNAIISSVAESPIELKNILRESAVKYFELATDTRVPVHNLYETPETLGKDRIAAVVGANFLYPESNILIIDAGTAITFDFINCKGQYLGGNISPGIRMRYNALHTFTHRLPLVEPHAEFPLFGRNTTEAIRVGVQSGIIYEVDGTIDGFKALYPDLHVILTGGDIKFFDNKLKNAIFAVSNLLMVGLHRILTYNAQNI
jgi:type III pantothenate kinase